MDWNQIANNPIYLGVIAGGVVLLLLLMALLWRRRRGRWVEENLPMTPQDIISGIGSMSPPFENLMEAFTAQNNLSEFLENHEVLAAFERLQDFLQDRQGAARKNPSLLRFNNQPSLSPEIRASLLTIARCIYSNEECEATLDEEARNHLDDLLDSLT